MSTNQPQLPVPGFGTPIEEPSRSGRSLVIRFALAALGVLLLSGGVTYYVAKGEIHKLVTTVVKKSIKHLSPSAVVATHEGQPETILLVGNDERRETTTEPVLPHSNEMLLVRIDPSKPTISMLSIPRELDVPIHLPDGEIEHNRINSAYLFGWQAAGGRAHPRKATAGGINLMDKTIKEVLGITINKVFITNFDKFQWAVDAMGCVYMMVDKRYFHSNSEPGAEQYMEINLQPGYQRVCGKHALEFVSNRHESTSLVRDARDQRFLLETKAQYGSSLFERRERFEEILGKTIETTVHNEAEVLELLHLLIESAGKPVRQVHFNVSFLPEFDTATPQQIKEARYSFMNGTTRIAAPALVKPRHPATTGPRGRRRAAAPPKITLDPTPSYTREQAVAIAPKLPFTVEVPNGQVSPYGAEPDEVHKYSILGPHHHSYPAYVIVVDQGELGQYYDVEGTSWTDPPLLETESSPKRIGRRMYRLYFAGEHLKTVAWREGGAVYWIENTLTYALSGQQMMAIAEATKPIDGTRAQSVVPRKGLSTTEIRIPQPPTKGQVPKTYKVGALIGFGGLGLVALLFPFALLRGRKLRLLRAEVADMMLMEERQRAHLLERIRYAAVTAARPEAQPAPPPAPPAAPAAESPAAETPAAETPAAETPAAESPGGDSEQGPVESDAPAAVPDGEPPATLEPDSGRAEDEPSAAGGVTQAFVPDFAAAPPAPAEPVAKEAAPDSPPSVGGDEGGTSDSPAADRTPPEEHAVPRESEEGSPESPPSPRET